MVGGLMVAALARVGVPAKALTWQLWQVTPLCAPVRGKPARVRSKLACFQSIGVWHCPQFGPYLPLCASSF